MRIHLIAVGTRMPRWVSDGFDEYARRLPAECRLQLHEIPLGKRAANADIPRLMAREGERMVAAIPRGALTIALDRSGEQLSTEALAERLQGWLQSGNDVALLVGGPEGLDPACLARSDRRLSLSPMTLPHPLVRIVIAEQLYRAWSLLNNHPYHR